MKKWIIVCALIAGVVLAQSESEGVEISQEKKDVSPPVVHGGRKTLFVDATRTLRRAKAQGHPYSDRDQSGRRRTEDDELSVSERESPPVTHIQTPAPLSESEYLKEIAALLSISVPKDDTPGDIAFKIKQCIENAERYRWNVLSDESFEKAKSAIRIPADAKTFAEYHKFIKRIEGKKLLICGEGKEK